MPTKKDKWAEVVEALKMNLDRPLNFVSAGDVKRITGEEPRLMASMTTEKLLPEIFRRQGVFVLPVSSNRYVIVHGKGYHQLEPVNGPPRRIKANFPFEMAMLGYGSGEQGHLLHAYHSGILGDFCRAQEMVPTMLGKARTGSFQFRVDGSPVVRVEGAGMEVDMGFDGRRDVFLFEAKAAPSETFLIRQLYYPYRVASSITNKSVRTFFFVANRREQTYLIWEYVWRDPMDYEQIKLQSAASYVIQAVEPQADKFEAIEPEPGLDIVPQADDFQKVADFPLLIVRGINTAAAWAEVYGISLRQGSYYREAAEALGLVDSEGGVFSLTPGGHKYVAMEVRRRDDFLAERLLKVPIVNKVYVRTRRAPHGVSREEIEESIRRASHLTGTTPWRRASTVLSYFRWLARATGVVVVRDGRVYSRQRAIEEF